MIINWMIESCISSDCSRKFWLTVQCTYNSRWCHLLAVPRFRPGGVQLPVRGPSCCLVLWSGHPRTEHLCQRHLRVYIWSQHQADCDYFDADQWCWHAVSIWRQVVPGDQGYWFAFHGKHSFTSSFTSSLLPYIWGLDHWPLIHPIVQHRCAMSLFGYNDFIKQLAYKLKYVCFIMMH